MAEPKKQEQETRALVDVTKARLPWVPEIGAKFGIDPAAWKALVEAIFPAAQSAEAVTLALSYCKARGLDPFKRCVHIVPVWDSASDRMVEGVWPGIAEHRITAMRTGEFGGVDPAQFGPTVKQTFSGQTKKGVVTVDMEFPDWCQITVYRIVKGQRVPVHGPRVYWRETYMRMGRADIPNERWRRSPSGMLEKCAEAAALRRAFPEEFGDEATAEEAGAYPPPVSADITPMPRPTRAQIAAEKEQPVAEAVPFPNKPDPVAVEVDSNQSENPVQPVAEKASGDDAPFTDETPLAQEPYALSQPKTLGECRAWATEFIGLIRTEASRQMINRWVDLNLEALNKMQAKVPAVYKTIDEAIKTAGGRK